MKNARNFLKNLLIITLPMIFILFFVLEIGSRLFFPGSMIPRSEFDEKHLLVKFNKEKGETGVATTGKYAQQRAKWRINNYGWNSPIDYTSKRNRNLTRIAVIGDSYIEAWQVDINKSYPYVLNKLLGSNFEIYSFGVSGAPLSQYLHMSRHVESEFDPDIYIFNLVHNDFNESIAGLFADKTYFMTIEVEKDSVIREVLPSTPKQRKFKRIPFRDIFNKSSFLRYLYENLKINRIFLNKPKLDKVEMNTTIDNHLSKSEERYAVTEYILKRLKEELKGKRVIFVLDAPRGFIYKNKIEMSKIIVLNQMMDELCNKLQMEYIDLTPFMIEDFKKHKTRFESVWDSHWNEYGHNFVTKTLYDYLENNK